MNVSLNKPFLDAIASLQSASGCKSLSVLLLVIIFKIQKYHQCSADGHAVKAVKLKAVKAAELLARNCIYSIHLYFYSSVTINILLLILEFMHLCITNRQNANVTIFLEFMDN